MMWTVTLSAYVPKSQLDTVIDEYKHKGKGYMIGATCFHSVLTMKTMFVMGAICWLGGSAPEATRAWWLATYLHASTTCTAAFILKRSAVWHLMCHKK